MIQIQMIWFNDDSKRQQYHLMHKSLVLFATHFRWLSQQFFVVWNHQSISEMSNFHLWSFNPYIIHSTNNKLYIYIFMYCILLSWSIISSKKYMVWIIYHMDLYSPSFCLFVMHFFLPLTMGLSWKTVSEEDYLREIQEAWVWLNTLWPLATFYY